MLGHYPESLADRSTWDVGRGRVLPTTPWEAPWNAISRWFGVSESQMPNVLPNVANFGADQLFVEEDLLRGGGGRLPKREGSHVMKRTNEGGCHGDCPARDMRSEGSGVLHEVPLLHVRSPT
eukprot:406834-Prymnesium_polylepis.1